MSDIYNALLQRGGQVDLDAAKEINDLRAENAALRADAEQLDWLEQHDGRFYNIDRITAIVGDGFNGGQKSLRAAIAKLKDQR